MGHPSLSQDLRQPQVPFFPFPVPPTIYPAHEFAPMSQGLDSCFKVSWGAELTLVPRRHLGKWIAPATQCCISFTDSCEIGLPEWHWYDDFKWLPNIKHGTTPCGHGLSCMCGSMCQLLPSFVLWCCLWSLAPKVNTRWQQASFILCYPKWCPLLLPLMWEHDAFPGLLKPCLMWEVSSHTLTGD